MKSKQESIEIETLRGKMQSLLTLADNYHSYEVQAFVFEYQSSLNHLTSASSFSNPFQCQREYRLTQAVHFCCRQVCKPRTGSNFSQ